MDFKQKKTHLYIGGLLSFSIGVVYYYLLVKVTEKFSLLFEKIEHDNLPIQTKIIFAMADFWWIFSLIVVAGVVAIYQSKPKLGNVLYLIPVVLLPVYVLIVIWAMYSPIFSMSESF